MGNTLKLVLILLLFYGGPASAVQQLESSEGFFILNFNHYSMVYDGLKITRLPVPHSQAKPDDLQQFDITGQRQVTLSGFGNGVYQARLIDSLGDKTPVLIAEIHVQHRSLSQALFLFGTGLAVFLLLAGLLLHFHYKEQNHA
ncbi:hypothetical protein [Nitrosomonas halophila]|uniref:Nickel transport protein n=1 Tax=Nitrosomonas halophila TaxID=44576 RepID=A0A1H3D452_9PROT|nr:hypothetical protein [Nitrosomonas halophila]SDX61145.1 hypothetical protein SAMN05421881_100446 [Nitrosomonas halophila]